MAHEFTEGSRTRSILLACILALAGAATSVRAEGLVLRTWDAPTANAHQQSEYALTSSPPSAQAVHVLGDYYFFDPANSTTGPALNSLMGGFRASTGVLGLARPLTLYDTRPDSLQNLPYFGLGYSRLWFKSQLSLNADFGLASGNLRGRTLFSGNQSLDDVTSQLRWAPVMAVNVRYSF